MKYFKTDCNKLIQLNTDTKVYKQRNTIEHVDTRIAEEDFLLLNPTLIKKTEFCRLMNIFYKDVKHSWKYEYTDFRKLDNFEDKAYNLSSNYNLGKDVPYHKIPIYGNCVLVYHWGRVYYHSISYGGYAQGQLIDMKTLSAVQWCKLKHCAPVMNVNTKKII